MAGFKAPSSAGKGFKVASNGGFGGSTFWDSSKAQTDNSPLAAILNFGQGVINTISTPMYGVQGFINKAAKEAKAGNANPLDVLWKSIEAGNKNATSWTRGEKTVMGEELLKNMGILRDDKFGDVKIGDFELNLPGLAADILLDPLTYIPGGVFVTAAKAPVVAGRTALKAGALAKTGQLAESVARKAAKTPAAQATVSAAKAGTPIPLKQAKGLRFARQGVTPAKIELAQSLEKIATEQGRALTKLEKTQIKQAKLVSKTDPDLVAYKTLQLGNSPLNTVNNQLASALEAGRLAMMNTIISDTAKRSLRKTNAREARQIRKGIESNISFEAVVGTARQAENVEVKAGEAALPLTDGTVQTVKENTIFRDGEKVHIWDGKNVWSWDKGDAATNTRLAEEYLAAKNAKPSAEIIGAPVLDSAPSTKILKELAKVANKTDEVKTINKTLATLDKLAKGAKSAAITGDNVAYKINEILKAGDPVKMNFWRGLSTPTRNLLSQAISGGKENIFMLIRYAMGSQNAQLKSAIREISTIVLTDNKGIKRTIGNLYADIESGKLLYANIPSDVKDQIRQEISVLISDSASAVQKAELEAIVGADVAAQILATGVIDPTAKTFNKGALNKIIAGIKAAPKVAEKKYENFDELLDGLKREDQIDTTTLTKILNALDPDNALVKQVDKIAAEDLNAQLAAVISRQGPQTVTASRRRLELLDPARILKADGLALHETISAYILTRLADKMPPLANAAGQSRQAAIAKVLADSNDVDGKDAIEKALVSLGTAIDSRLEYLYKIMDSSDAKVFISSLDDAAMRSTTQAYAIGSRAATYLQANTNFTTALIGSLLGISSKRAANKAKAYAKTKKTYVPKTADEKAEALAFEMATAEDLALAILGVRFTAAKTAAKAIEEETGKHFAYIHLGDMIDVFRQDDLGKNLINRSLFPETAKQTDSFSYYGMTEAVRMVMEARELNRAPNRQEIVKTLLSRGKEVKDANGTVIQPAQALWSKEFKDTAKQTAEEMTDYILREDVIANFENIHLSKAVAGVEDSIGDVTTLTQDVINSLLEGFRANKRSGNMSDARRTEMAREAFAKFTYSAGFLEGRGGKEAAALMKIASTMFLRDGRMANIREAKDFIAQNMLPEEQGQMDELIAMIDLMYKTDSPYKTLADDADGIKAPTQAAVDKAQANLSKAEIEYNAHMKEWAAKSATETGAKEWAALHTTLRKKLDTARNGAEKVGIEPRYWVMTKFDETMGQEPWVAKSAYNHLEATKQVNKAEDRFARVQGKVLDRSKSLVDIAPTDAPKKLTKAQRERVLNDWNEAARKRAMELSDGASIDAAQYAQDILPDLEAAMDPYSALIRSEQERIAYKYAQIEERIDVPDAEDIATLERQTKTYSPTYKDAKVQRAKGLETQKAGTMLKQRWNANSNEAISYLRNAETKGFHAKNKISKVVRDLGDMLDKIDPAAFARADDAFVNPAEAQLALRGRMFTAAWNAARTNAPVPPSMGDDFAKVVGLTQSVIKAAESQLAGMNMDPALIDRYFKKYGINDFEGFKMPSKYSTPEAFTKKFFDDLPYNENKKPVGSDSFKSFAQRKDDFEKSGNDPYLMFSNIISAMIDAKTEQVLVHDFISQFGYKAEGQTMKQALDKGKVAIKAIPGISEFDLSAHLVGMENKGALFDPEIADMFAGLNREWDYLQGKQLGPILRYMMDFTGVLKTTQTTLRPGHVMTNVIGDTAAALIRGAREGRHWINGMKYAKQFMQESVKADGFMFMKGDTEASLQRAVGSFMRLDDKAELKIADATAPGYNVVLNGKKVRIDDETMRAILTEAGVLNDNIINTDIQGLFEASQARFGEVGPRGSHAKTLYSRAKLRFDSATKPAGDVTAYYSNIPRVASALSVIDNKNWSSIAELKRAVADDVHLYHPSIFSLTATERKYPRAIFTYYTWLRVAHNALIDMALNHTAAMMLYPKVQANAAAQANYEPMSIGDPWGVNKQSTPQYLNYSTYAPMGAEGPRGAMIMKPSYLPFDVLDTWNWTYNPYKSWDENIGGVITQVGRTLGRSTNVVAQPGIEFLTGTDMNTGKALQNRNLETFGDEIISNIGYGGLLKGLGVYTPANKRPENTSNPITDRDRELYLQNWIFGLKRQDLNTISSQQNARNDQNQYMKDFMNWYSKQQKETPNE